MTHRSARLHIDRSGAADFRTRIRDPPGEPYHFGLKFSVSFEFIIASPAVWVAVVVYCSLALIEPVVESRLHKAFADNAPMQWGWDRFFAPLVRALMLVTFVYLAYPGIFGLRVAPPIVELVSGGEARLNTLVGLLFFAGFIASLVPGLARHPEFVLPLQGSLAAGYFFFWLTTYLGVTTASLWPGIDVLLVMLCFSYAGHRIAGRLGKFLGDWIDDRKNTRGYDRVIVHMVELLAQVPVILLFGYGLGRQLAI